MNQEIIVFVLVIVAVFFLVRRFVRSAQGKANCGCAGCGGCESGRSASPEQLETDDQSSCEK